MVSKCIRASLFAALGVFAVALSYGSAATPGHQDKQDEKVPDISEIMLKGHKGTDAYINRIKTAAKAGKWEDAEKYAKTLAFFGDNLGKNKPPKGSAESWAKLTKKYQENTKAVYKATEDKNAKEVNKSLGAITSSCGQCHKAHK